MCGFSYCLVRPSRRTAKRVGFYAALGSSRSVNAPPIENRVVTADRNNSNGKRTGYVAKRAVAVDRGELLAENASGAVGAAPVVPPPAAVKKVGAKRVTIQAKRVGMQEIRIAPEPIPDWSEVRENAGWTGVPAEREHGGRVTVKSPIQVLRSRFLPEISLSTPTTSPDMMALVGLLWIRQSTRTHLGA